MKSAAIIVIVIVFITTARTRSISRQRRGLAESDIGKSRRHVEAPPPRRLLIQALLNDVNGNEYEILPDIQHIGFSQPPPAATKFSLFGSLTSSGRHRSRTAPSRSGLTYEVVRGPPKKVHSSQRPYQLSAAQIARVCADFQGRLKRIRKFFTLECRYS